MGRIDCQLLQQRKGEFERNKSGLKSIIECIINCGKQSIPLRSHRDDSTADKDSNKGNLNALIEFRAETDATISQIMCTKCSIYIKNDSK